MTLCIQCPVEQRADPRVAHSLLVHHQQSNRGDRTHQQELREAGKPPVADQNLEPDDQWQVDQRQASWVRRLTSNTCGDCKFGGLVDIGPGHAVDFSLKMK